MINNKQIVGLVGPFGSGKSTVGQYFQEKGFTVIRLSSFLENEAKKRFGKIDRQGLQDIGNEFRKKYGPGILAEWAIRESNKKSKIVIDGIRNLSEIKFLKKQNNFYLLGISADQKKRYERLMKIKAKKIPDWGQFLKLDSRDKGKGQSITGLQISKCLLKADYLIENNGDKKELLLKINQFLETL